MVVIGGIEQKTHFFVMDLPHSDACFVRAYPAATAEAWVDGHVHAFAFFGKVPVSVLYDNDRCLVAKILPDGTRQRATLFSGFMSHYLFRDRYGRPGKGNDKGNAEGLVGYSRRKLGQFMTRIDHVDQSWTQQVILFWRAFAMLHWRIQIARFQTGSYKEITPTPCLHLYGEGFSFHFPDFCC